MPMPTPPVPAVPPAEPGSESPAYLRIPGLGVLALNFSALSVLTAVWEGLPGNDAGKLVFTGAFIAFALGVIAAVASLAGQFHRDTLDAKQRIISSRLRGARQIRKHRESRRHYGRRTRWVLYAAAASLLAFLTGVLAAGSALIVFKVGDLDASPVSSAGGGRVGGDTILYNDRASPPADPSDPDAIHTIERIVERCPAPPQPPVCPPAEPSKLCRCSGSR